MLKVAKFGGSSLASSGQMAKVGEIVRLTGSEGISFLPHRADVSRMTQRSQICSTSAMTQRLPERISMGDWTRSGAGTRRLLTVCTSRRWISTRSLR